MGFTIAIAVIAMLAGAIFYNPIRRKLAGTVGVGGCYFILIGVITLVMFIGRLCAKLFSTGSKVSTMEMVLTALVAVAGICYLVYVMMTRCTSVAQRILLPFAACLVGLGFCWRFLFNLLLHVPMESGQSEGSNSQWPQVIQQAKTLNSFQFQWSDADNRFGKYYCAKTGETIELSQGEVTNGSDWQIMM